VKIHVRFWKVGRRGGRLDDDGASARGREAGLVGGDVGDGVGGHCARIDLHGAHGGAVDEGLDVEVEVGLGVLSDEGVLLCGRWIHRVVPVRYCSDCWRCRAQIHVRKLLQLRAGQAPVLTLTREFCKNAM
jgi:hypothetical protein